MFARNEWHTAGLDRQVRATPVDSHQVSATPGAATPDHSWGASARAVFAELLAQGPLTRAAIADLTGLSRVTASGIVDQLIRRGFVEQAAPSTAGPSARTYAVVPDCGYAAGVAIDTHRIAMMLTNITGSVVTRFEQPIEDDDTVIETVERAIKTALESVHATPSNLRQIVLGASGVIDPAAHEVSFAVDQPSWKQAMPGQLRASLQCPVMYENDVNLAALAEARFGAGRHLATRGDLDMVLVWLDDGIACGVILHDRIYRGASGWAGEIAFLPSIIYGPGEEVTGDQSVATLQSAIGIRGATALAEEHRVDIDAVLRFDSSSDDAEPVRAEVARRIALAASGPIFIFDPDLVVLAGSVVRHVSDALLERVRQELAAIGPAPAALKLSKTGPDAILMGSMLLALDEARDHLIGGR